MRSYNTCAYALPEAPPLLAARCQKLYQVTKFCRFASLRGGFHVLQNDLIICLTCPLYTNRSKVINIRKDDFHAMLFLDQLINLPIRNLRKIFRLALSGSRENEAAITTLNAYLDTIVSDSKKAEEKISDPRAAKKAKALYERWVKIQALWNDVKHKMNFQ